MRALANARYVNSDGTLTPEGQRLLNGNRFAATIGDGVETAYAITHGLGTADIAVEVYEIATGETISADVARTSANVVTVTITPAPALNAVRVVIMA